MLRNEQLSTGVTMKITKQIIGGYAILLCLMMIVCGVASYDIFRLNQAAKQMIHEMEIRPLVEKVHNLILKQASMEKEYLLTRNEVFLEDYSTYQLELEDLFAERVVETFSESEGKLIEFLKYKSERQKNLFDEMVELSKRGMSEEKVKEYIEQSGIQTSLTFSELENLLDFKEGSLTRIMEIANEEASSAYRNMIVIIICTLIFGTVLILYIPKKITQPINRLVQTIRVRSETDFNQKIDGINNGNEISILESNFFNMLHNVRNYKLKLDKINKENEMLLEKTENFNKKLKIKVEKVTRKFKQKQEELIQAAKFATIGELSTAIAHEIRNPLSGISVALQLQKNERLTKAQKETIDDVLSEIDRLNRIITDLLAFAKPHPPIFTKVSPNDLVERAVGVVSPILEEKNIEMNLSFDKNLPEFIVDPEQIQQVILNLTINAVDAIKDQGKMQISTKRDNGNIIIEVKDNGIGIPQKNLDRLFYPFFTTKGAGTGLGLSISKSIIEGHKGTINVESKVNKGSVFSVVLPEIIKN